MKKNDKEIASPCRNSNTNTQSRKGLMARRDQVRVLVVDDSRVVRSLITKILEENGFKVVATADTGYAAIDELKRYEVDVVLLDIEMPKMDGLEALPHLKKIDPDVTILMLSSLTQKGAQISMRALQLGATDFIPKPSAARSAGALDEMKRTLIDLLVALTPKMKSAAKKVSPPKSKAQAPEKRPLKTVQPPTAKFAPTNKIKNVKAPLRTAAKSVSKKTAPPVKKVPSIALRKATLRGRPECLVVGSSTGGPNALSHLFKTLDSDIGLPIFVAQHMPPMFTKTLAERLNRESSWSCAEAVDGEIAKPGHIYIAPGDYHMTLKNEGSKTKIKLNQNPQVNFCRPAVDVLFESAAEEYKGKIVATILTGMGQDGKIGAELIAREGGIILAQDEETSVVWGMPGAVTKAGIANTVLPIDKIGKEIQRHIRNKVT